MVIATRLQLRRGASSITRGVAVALGLWLVVCGVLGARHEARVAHVLDRAGLVHHAQQLAGHHDGRQSDVHGQAGDDAEHGVCGLSTILHQPATPEVARLGVVDVSASYLVVVTGQPRAASPARRVYRLAPKTSPPIA